MHALNEGTALQASETFLFVPLCLLMTCMRSHCRAVNLFFFGGRCYSWLLLILLLCFVTNNFAMQTTKKVLVHTDLHSCCVYTYWSSNSIRKVLHVAKTCLIMSFQNFWFNQLEKYSCITRHYISPLHSVCSLDVCQTTVVQRTSSVGELTQTSQVVLLYYHGLRMIWKWSGQRYNYSNELSSKYLVSYDLALVPVSSARPFFLMNRALRFQNGCWKSVSCMEGKRCKHLISLEQDVTNSTCLK